MWYDQDQDGIQDADEDGVQGVTATLHDNGTCTSTTGQADVTDADGLYGFGNLSTGTYSVQFSGLPADWSISPAGQGGDDSADSDANGSACIQNIVLAASDLTNDMGIYTTGSLGDTVWCESTTNPNMSFDPGDGDTGINDVTMSLYEDFDCNGSADGAAIDTMTTANGGSPLQDGFYEFTGQEVALAGGNAQTQYLVVVGRTDADLGSCTTRCRRRSTIRRWTATIRTTDNDFVFGAVRPGRPRVVRPGPGRHPGPERAGLQRRDGRPVRHAGLQRQPDRPRRAGLWDRPVSTSSPTCWPATTAWPSATSPPAGASARPTRATARMTAAPTTAPDSEHHLAADDPDEDMGIYMPGSLGDTSGVKARPTRT